MGFVFAGANIQSVVYERLGFFAELSLEGVPPLGQVTVT